MVASSALYRRMSEGGQEEASSSGSFWGWANEAASKMQVEASRLAGKASVEAARFAEKAEVASKEAKAHFQQSTTEFVEKSQRLADDIARKANEVNLSEMVLGVDMMGGGSSGDGGHGKGKQKPHVLDMSYITENIIQMSFPYDSEAAKKNGGNDVYGVAELLERRHNGHYMIWNISEEAYDYNLFDNQVLEYKFPGHPSPPLGLMFNICTSIESWLDADPKNVAVVHCLTGKGRSASLLACVLTWLGEFSSPTEALQYIADRRNIAVDFLTIPSQRRYVQYFSNMLDGVRPQPHHLLLRRAIMHDIPAFVQTREIMSEGKSPGTPGTKEVVEEPGCCPYVQLFKNGKMIATAVPVNHDERTLTKAAQQQQSEDVVGSSSSSSSSPSSSSSSSSSSSEEIGATPAKLQKPRLELKWVPTSEGTATFSLDTAVQGDILLRCRHAELVSGQRVSMFRAAFHTGYVPSGVLRLTKVQLDGAGADPRFSDEFFLDLIFAPIEPNSTGTAGSSAEGSDKPPSDSGIQVEGEFSERYEQTLHRDVRFWESIAARKNKAKRRRARKFVSTTHDQFSIGEDDKGGGGSTEIVFSNSHSHSSSDISPDDDGLAASNMDLIAALAEAEDFGDEDMGLGGGNGDDDDDASGFVPISAAAVDAASAVPAPTTPAAKEANDNLAALDELEKELGIDGDSMFVAEQSFTPKGAGAGADTSIEEEFDELEKYLESLATPSK